MRIAHVTDFYLPRLGGIEMHVHDLAYRQHLAGHVVEIITSTPDPSAAVDGPPGGDGPVVHRLASPDSPGPFGGGTLRAGRRLLREGKYDVVHVHAGLVSPLAFAAAGLAGEIPTVVTVHSLLSYLRPVFRLLAAGTRWHQWPAVWTAVSDVAAAPLRRIVHPAQVHVLPNGIDEAQWHTPPAARDGDDVLLVAVLRLAHRKRPHHLLEILRNARRMLPEGQRLRAVLVGEGPMRPRLERYLRRHGMTGWVDLPGRMSRTEIGALLARADIFVAPAILESFGIAALEARCAGVPVVARRQGGIGEFIGHGTEGLLAHDDNELAAAIARLVTDRPLRERIAVHNRQTAPPLGWPLVLNRTTQVYELATATRGSSIATPA